MALRVPKAEFSTEMSENMIKQLGAVAEPVEVVWHNPKVATSNFEVSAKLGEWDAADASLKSFAHMAVASQVPRWRDSELFTPLERDVLKYAEAMTNTPPTVTGELHVSLLDRLGAAAMVELTAYIAFVSMATRNWFCSRRRVLAQVL
ncbi:carboxymuconolactone decarboxylase family protein [Streptomyces sp. NBC_01433]|uniref:carboxymuconolactone decarboxylase family protein n=1 Tax=Streptomyces sp. NBC_01433 TaxID=2903864 RepID=UPI002255E97F|nr:carboxymuconolactone decarboxylase family protein [Streptomyces sp. NBC_01433]MCX4681968.1 carboxymuconolactone decarboxylase family protein [Streptomyces sp. NBC_01433]